MPRLCYLVGFLDRGTQIYPKRLLLILVKPKPKPENLNPIYVDIPTISPFKGTVRHPGLRKPTRVYCETGFGVLGFWV